MPNDTVNTAAEARFAKKEQKTREGEAAMSAYLAEKRATDAKTARLREARLAKEAADREAALNTPTLPVKKKRRATASTAAE